jgi:hypothetical protein
MPEGCRCRCIDSCSGPSIPSTVPSRGMPSENADSEPPEEANKRRRISLDTPHSDPKNPPVRRYQAQPITVEERRTPYRSGRKPGETPTPAQPRRDGILSTVQTPSDGKCGNQTVPRGHLGSAQPGSGTAPLATRLSLISRGIAPSVILVSHSERPLTRFQTNNKICTSQG